MIAEMFMARMHEWTTYEGSTSNDSNNSIPTFRSMASLSRMNSTIMVYTTAGPISLVFMDINQLQEQLHNCLSAGQINSSEYYRAINEAQTRQTQYVPFQWTTISSEGNTVSSSTINSLTLKQKWIEKQYKKDPYSVKGLKVKVIVNDLGLPISPPILGLIVKVTFDQTKKQNTYSIFRDDNGEILNCWIFQLETIENLKKIDPKDKKTLIDMFLEKMNKKRNSEYANFDKRLVATNQTIDAYLNKIKQLEQEIEDLKKLKTTSSIFTVKELIKLLESLRKHIDVEDAFLSSENTLVILTKTLYPTTPRTHKKNLKKPIGRFYFSFSFNDSSGITILNRDFYVGDEDYIYEHPHIKNSEICWGSNGQEITLMWKKQQIYELVDFIILFLSTYPHDGGDPYIPYDEWMDEKQPKTKETIIPQKIL